MLRRRLFEGDAVNFPLCPSAWLRIAVSSASPLLQAARDSITSAYLQKPEKLLTSYPKHWPLPSRETIIKIIIPGKISNENNQKEMKKI